MKVWIGYLCSNNSCDVFRYVERVFDDEVKALLWAEDKTFTDAHDSDYDWREYSMQEVE